MSLRFALIGLLLVAVLPESFLLAQTNEQPAKLPPLKFDERQSRTRIISCTREMVRKVVRAWVRG